MKRNKLASSIFMVAPICAAMTLVTNPSYAATDKKPIKKIQQRPNIVLMMADNLGYGDLGVYGGGENRGMPTPNIDQLASEGLRFDQFLVEHTCSATRAATLTGRYSIRTSVGVAMQTSEITLADMLKDVGYATAAYGKWHIGWGKGQQPQDRGFDEFYGVKDAANKVTYIPSILEQHIKPEKGDVYFIYELVNGQMIIRDRYDEKTRRTIDHELANKAVAFIQTNTAKDKPFFLYLPWTRVHYPNYVSKKFEGISRIGLYGDGVMELDYHTGKVLKAIEDNEIEDNTIVIWMSDNGPMRTAAWPDGGFQGPFRGDIGSAKEGSIRTAGMIKWPGHIEPGVMYDMFSTMDFVPTLAKFADAERKISKDRPIDGIDQSDFLLNYKPPTLRAKMKRQICKICQVPPETNYCDKDLIPSPACSQCLGNAPRDNLLTFINGDLMAVRWKQFRIYPNSLLPQEGFMAIEGSGSMNVPNLSPIIYNIERDPREVVDTHTYNGWVRDRVQPYLDEYACSVEKYPNPSDKDRSLKSSIGKLIGKIRSIE
jgi:arylsulfatase A-like enzyme